MKRELVCVSCPIGCALSVELSEDGKEVLSVPATPASAAINMQEMNVPIPSVC